VTPAGIVLALAALFVAMVMGGGKPASIIDVSSLILVFGGTIGATLAGMTRKEARRLPRVLAVAMRRQRGRDPVAFTNHLLELAREARTGGMKVIEAELPEAKSDPFTRTGVELIATTSDPERVRAVLEAEVLGMLERHRAGYKAFQDMAGFAPTIGILGTVVGLVHVLGSLTSPGRLGPAIATAFTATLWGVLSANIFWLPIANKLRHLSQNEQAYKELVIEGLLAVQEGLSGPQLRDRLEPFLAPHERPSERAEAA